MVFDCRANNRQPNTGQLSLRYDLAKFREAVGILFQRELLDLQPLGATAGGVGRVRVIINLLDEGVQDRSELGSRVSKAADSSTRNTYGENRIVRCVEADEHKDCRSSAWSVLVLEYVLGNLKAKLRHVVFPYPTE